MFPSTVDVLQKNLDLRQGRHEILTSNIANAETPGYIAKELHFEKALHEATKPTEHGTLQRTHPLHLHGPASSIQDVQGDVVTSPSDDVGNDLNSVSIDQEMAKLTMNTFHYNASTVILSRMFTQIRHTISEGGR
jgi:flagellar basal-body rod protein FlgB